jgi:hypothetical protein
MLPAITARHRAERRQLDHLADRSAPRVPELRPRYVTIDTACRYAGIGRSKFYRDYLERVRTLRLGKRNLVELNSLDELLDQLACEQEAERAAS